MYFLLVFFVVQYSLPSHFPSSLSSVQMVGRNQNPQKIIIMAVITCDDNYEWRRLVAAMQQILFYAACLLLRYDIISNAYLYNIALRIFHLKFTFENPDCKKNIVMHGCRNNHLFVTIKTSWNEQNTWRMSNHHYFVHSCVFCCKSLMWIIKIMEGDILKVSIIRYEKVTHFFMTKSW